MDLLAPIDEEDRTPFDKEELMAMQATIVETLRHFGVSAPAGGHHTRPDDYPLRNLPRRRSARDRITALERDIARATRAACINILAPIPGKDTVGIEIANSNKVKVTLRELF